MGTKVEIKLTHHGPWFMATNHGQFFGRLTLHDIRKGTKSGQKIDQDSKKVMIRLAFLFMIEL